MNSKAFHFTSAALVSVFGSMAAWHWGDVVSATTAAQIVTGLGVAKAVASLFGNSNDSAS